MKMSTVAQVVQSEGIFPPPNVGISIHGSVNTGKAYKKGEEITFLSHEKVRRGGYVENHSNRVGSCGRAEEGWTVLKSTWTKRIHKPINQFV